jgi:hypothetical protein
MLRLKEDVTPQSPNSLNGAPHVHFGGVETITLPGMNTAKIPIITHYVLADTDNYSSNEVEYNKVLPPER